MPTGSHVRVKICGLTRRTDLEAAVNAGADYVGLVRYPKSPRNVSLEQARLLTGDVPESLCLTVLTVNPTDEEVDRLLDALNINLLQLHGSESPDRVAELRDRHDIRIMKAIGIANRQDIDVIDDYSDVVDQILVDAKPASVGSLPGGNGLSFDWRLLEGIEWKVPWMLAGGLDADNVAAAVNLTCARQLDVSSGVESQPGIKDPSRIADFIRAARET